MNADLDAPKNPSQPWIGRSEPPPPPESVGPMFGPKQPPVSAALEVLVAAIAVGFATNLAVRSGVVSLGGFAAVVAAAVALRVLVAKSSTATVFLAGAVSLSPWLFLRTSPYLFVVTLPLITLFLILAAVSSRWSNPLDLRLERIVVQTLTALGLMVGGALPFLVRALPKNIESATNDSVKAVARGVLIAAPIIAILGGLLATGDAVFGGLLGQFPSIGPLTGHVLLSLVFAVPFGGLVAAAQERNNNLNESNTSKPLGAVETLTVLTGLVGLYSLYAVSQLIAALGAADRILTTAGLTQAEYARSGFFDLLWVAALTLLVLLVLLVAANLKTASQRLSFNALSVAAIALTELIVFGAASRLVLYAENFGWTMLRLFSFGFVLWVGAVFLLVAAEVLRSERGPSWFPATVMLSTWLLITGANFFNPEQFVVDYNIDRAAESADLDVDYLVFELSDDGQNQLISRFNDLSEENQKWADRLLCRRSPATDNTGLKFNFFERNLPRPTRRVVLSVSELAVILCSIRKLHGSLKDLVQHVFG